MKEISIGESSDITAHILIGHFVLRPHIALDHVNELIRRTVAKDTAFNMFVIDSVHSQAGQVNYKIKLSIERSYEKYTK